MTTALHFSPYMPSTLKEHYFSDVPAPAAGDDGKALTYRHSLTDFVYTSFEAAGAVATHVGQANPHTQYLLATSYNANDILAKLLTVDADNTGLNATTLQGYTPSAFDAAGLAAAAAAGAATALATHAGVASGVHGIASFGATLNATANQAAAQTALGLLIGTNVQAQNANLAAIAGLTTAANKVEYWTGSGAAALADFTSYGRGLVASANVAATGLLAADGSVTGATAGAQAFTNGVKTAKVYPTADNINAVGFYKADGFTPIAVGDTTNMIFTIGTAALGQLRVNGDRIFFGGGGSSVEHSIVGPGTGDFVDFRLHNSTSQFFRISKESTYGTNDLFFYMATPGAGHAVLECSNAQSLSLSSSPSVPIRFLPNRVEAARFTGAGLLAVGQTSATALLDIAASTTARASLRIRSGVRPTVSAGNPNDGEIWYDGTHVYMRIAGADKQLDN